MFRRFITAFVAFIGAMLVLPYLWPRHQHVILGLGASLFALAVGASMAAFPAAARQTFYEGQATERSRRMVERSPLIGIRIFGVTVIVLGLYLLYVVTVCPSYSKACMGPFTILGIGI